MAERVRMRDCPDGSRRASIGNLFEGTGSNSKTAAYQLLLTDRGKLFTNAGASGSVTFTLPADATVPVGWWCMFKVEAAQALVVAATSLNAAATLTNSTAGGSLLVFMGGDGKFSAIPGMTWT